MIHLGLLAKGFRLKKIGTDHHEYLPSKIFERNIYNLKLGLINL